jgi:hypothetical protein
VKLPAAVLAFVCLSLGALGCSSEAGTPPAPETVVSPTTPAPADPEGPDTSATDATLAHSTLAMSPACGAEGTRVMLRLDWTSDKRVPDCLLAEKFDVRFGSKAARITKLGKMNEGWCALDVLVPKGAASAEITVTVDHDVYESPTSFASPCQ